MSLGKRKRKSEHAGAKNGGGHWGTREEAKRISKKVRRAQDQKEESGWKSAFGQSRPPSSLKAQITNKAKHRGCPDCIQTRKIVQSWLDQQGHDRCWYYPDLFRSLVKLLGLSATKAPKLPPRREFEEGCKRYQSEEFGPEEIKG